MPLTNFPNGVSSFGIPVLPGQPLPFTGNYFFVDPVNGVDGNQGTSPARAFKTLYQAYAKCVDGHNDVVFIISDGSSASTARLSTASAQTIVSTATTGTLTWAKDACHIIGITAPSMAKRARISNATTETRTTFNSGDLVTVTASGCLFANFSVFQGFATGGASEIAWTDSGGRNNYYGVEFLGGGDTAATTTNVATMRSLLITGNTGENTFVGCTIGLDTLARSTGSFEFELAGGSPRNVFENCQIVTNAGAVGCAWLKVGASGIDRYALFRNCSFINPIASGATSMTTGFSVNASPGGAILLQNCLAYGATAIDTAGTSFTNIANAATAGGRVAAASA